jgi:MFS family permease
MGLAVNSSTFGMAAAGLAMAFYSQRIERRTGIFWSLCLLSIPTTLLAFAPNLAVFAALRVTQGLFMATAFSLTLAYLGERFSDGQTVGAFAAYITGHLSRVPAFHHNDAARWACGEEVWDANGDLGRPCGGRHRLAAPCAPQD